MAHFQTSDIAKKKILASSVRMFLEKGFKQTTMLDILSDSGLSAGTFQNLFRTKDGVLAELISFMFDWQFERSKALSKGPVGPLTLYSYETALQLSLTEQSEHIREIYLEAYSNPRLLSSIHSKMVPVLKAAFGSYHPDWEDADFFELEIGSAGLMRGYMSFACNVYFPLSKKVARFLNGVYALYDVPMAAKEKTLSALSKIDFLSLGKETMGPLFSALETAFDFTFIDKENNK